MYKKSPFFKSPESENVKIWRYLDFTKFISLLETNSLYFARADQFNDPFEGSYTKADVQNRNEKYRESVKGQPERLSPDIREKTIVKFNKN